MMQKNWMLAESDLEELAKQAEGVNTVMILCAAIFLVVLVVGLADRFFEKPAKWVCVGAGIGFLGLGWLIGALGAPLGALVAAVLSPPRAEDEKREVESAEVRRAKAEKLTREAAERKMARKALARKRAQQTRPEAGAEDVGRYEL